MPNVFISYRHENKEIVTQIVKHLQKSFVHVWVDDHKNLPPGSIIAGGISQGIQKCDIFMPFISTQYLDSGYCLEELSIANSYRIKNKLKIIPIVIDKNFNTTQINIDNQKVSLLQTLLETTKYIMVNTEESMNYIVDAVWNDEKVRFQPIEYVQMQNVKLQKITIEMVGNLPPDFLHNWKFNFEEFIAQDDRDTVAPIKAKLPVALFGKTTGWLAAYLLIPLKNLCTIFLYNNVTKNYICVYSISDNIQQGTVLNESVV